MDLFVLVSRGVFKCPEEARNMGNMMCAMFKVWPAEIIFGKSLAARKVLEVSLDVQTLMFNVPMFKSSHINYILRCQSTQTL